MQLLLAPGPKPMLDLGLEETRVEDEDGDEMLCTV